MVQSRILWGRLRSWGWDYLVVASWLLVVLVVIGVPTLLGWVDLDAIWTRPVVADAVVLLLTVVPAFTYLTLTEAGSSQATWGKRRARLFVASSDGGRPAVVAIGARNLVKLLPWQAGHMAALRFAAETQEAFALACLAASVALTVAVVGPIVVGRRGLHDVAAGTQVIARRSMAEAGQMWNH